MKNEITEVTRRAIIDFLTYEKISWAGRLNEDEFLSRLFDLSSIRSLDHRYTNAAGDIHQHRVNNYDWNDDWVFYDTRFNILWVKDEIFLKFLCETIHPVVRYDDEDVEKILSVYNKYLEQDGWTLKEIKKISGRPVYSAQKIDQRKEIFNEPTGWQKVDRQLQEVRHRLDSAINEEQYQAVGLLCREVLISVSQELFDIKKYPVPDGVQPSPTDAKRMLEAIFEKELSGSTNKESRSHANAALRLALALQHKRTADFRMAAICAESTFSVVNLLAIIAGRRGRII
jgi:hypothetical protein